MKPIIILMLCIQVGILLATIYAVAVRKPSAGRGPVWSSLATSLMVVGVVSNWISQDHPAAPGDDILEFGAAILIGMAVMAAMMLIRQRREAGDGSSHSLLS